MKELNKFKTFPALAEAVGLSERELWSVIIGGVTRDMDAAERLAEISGISAMTFTFCPASRLRPGFLDWIAFRTKISKTQLWHLFRGVRGVNNDSADALEALTGINRRAWIDGSSWMMEMVREKNVETADATQEA